MSEPYFNQLLAISDMLESPHSATAEDGLSLLWELLQENSQDTEFINEVRSMVKDFPILEPEILEMIDRCQVKKSQTLEKPAGKKEGFKKVKSLIPKIFISYSHKDEKFKDELVTMLIPLQNNGVLEIWQDRKIEEGDEWNQAIQDAMKTCDLALLLVSNHFLASSFIGNEELPNLLQQRKEQGLRVVPIIISQCMWQSIPVLKDLQALPKDGKPVVGFTGRGNRDKVWTEIARTIESRVKKLIDTK